VTTISTYVLIHGAWHGGWCWDKVVPLLREAGHDALAPDLPGHGADKTPIADISLDTYVSKVGEVLRAATEPVILVGHSLGGVSITQAAEAMPERIRCLVYLTAFLLVDGQCVRDILVSDPESSIHANRLTSEDGTTSTVRETALREVFYADCSEADVARARSLLVPEATAIPRTPVRTTPENFSRVPRVYIECLRDRAITVGAQRRMHEALPCRNVFSLDTSHSPFFSAPEALVAHLLSV
jgi:pimeloyl-ACP methyl ester carboxylesterase